MIRRTAFFDGDECSAGGRADYGVPLFLIPIIALSMVDLTKTN